MLLISFSLKSIVLPSIDAKEEHQKSTNTCQSFNERFNQQTRHSQLCRDTSVMKMKSRKELIEKKPKRKRSLQTLFSLSHYQMESHFSLRRKTVLVQWTLYLNWERMIDIFSQMKDSVICIPSHQSHVKVFLSNDFSPRLCLVIISVFRWSLVSPQPIVSRNPSDWSYLNWIRRGNINFIRQTSDQASCSSLSEQINRDREVPFESNKGNERQKNEWTRKRQGGRESDRRKENILNFFSLYRASFRCVLIFI